MAVEHRFASWLPEGLKAADLYEPSPAALRHAIALGTQLRRPAPGWLAVLLFDSSTETLAAGVRHAPAGDRRLLFQVQASGSESPGHQLDLQLRLGRDHRIELTGQLLPPLPGAIVRTESGRRRHSKPLGPSGEFLFRGAASSNRSITLRIETEDGQALVLPDLRIVPLESDGS